MTSSGYGVEGLRVGFLVETPITHQKKMYGAQISFVAMIAELMERGVVPFVVVSEKWEMTDALERLGADVFITPIWEFFRSLDGVYEAVHEEDWQAEMERRSEELVATHFAANGVQVVHMNTRFAGLIGARVARALGLPYVYHVREFLAEDFGLAFKDPSAAQDLVGGADALIAISDEVAIQLAREYPGCRVDRIYNGIDVGRFDAPPVRRFGGDKVRLVLVGRVVEHKGQLEAIRAVESLPPHLRDRVKLNIVGHRPEEMGAYEEALQDYVEEHQLGSLVTFTPFTSDVSSLLPQFDIGLMCSTREAFGRVTVEYMLARLLVIGAASGGTVEIIEPGVNGYTYTPGDHLDLARVIAHALEDPSLSNEIIATAHARAVERFDARDNAENVVALYRRVLAAHVQR